MAPNGRQAAGPRCIAIVGPFQSGKTTLLEAILERTVRSPAQAASPTATASAMPAPRPVLTA